MKNNTQGFTLIELLIVVAIIGILAAVLIPNLLGARKKANDAAAASVARQVVNAMAAVEVGNTVGGVPGCSYASNLVTITTTPSSNESARVNAPAPINNVTCSAAGTKFTTTVSYAGGSSTAIIVDAEK